MFNVLFDIGKYSFKPGAREELAKVAGILLAYPGLNIEVGGHTDNFDENLSGQRVGSVRITSYNNGGDEFGYGQRLWQHAAGGIKRCSAGRQQNRRVGLVVSGDAIGNPLPITGSLR